MTVHSQRSARLFTLVYDPDPDGLAVPGHTLRLNEHEVMFGLRYCNFTPGAILSRRGKQYQVTQTGSLRPIDSSL